MMTFLKAFPILLILFGTPILIIFGLSIRAYRNYQLKKYNREHAEELEELEKQYKDFTK